MDSPQVYDTVGLLKTENSSVIATEESFQVDMFVKETIPVSRLGFRLLFDACVTSPSMTDDFVGS